MASGSAAAPAAAAVQAPPSPTPSTVTAEAIRSAVQELLQGKDLSAISLSELREQVAQKLGFASDAWSLRNAGERQERKCDCRHRSFHCLEQMTSTFQGARVIDLSLTRAFPRGNRVPDPTVDGRYIASKYGRRFS